MNMAHYLEHLAELGVTDLHPLGRGATGQLLAVLDLRPGQCVLEVGCGTAGTMTWLAGQAAVTIHGIEPLPAMLPVAQKRRRWAGLQAQTSLSQASGTAVCFAAATFDRVYTESVVGFQPAAEARAMLQQIWRVLKPGGRYVANEAIWKPGVTAAQAADIYSRSMADFGICQASPQAWGLAEWLAVMQETGFEMVTADLLAPAKHKRNGRWRWSVLASDGLTWLYHARRYFTPRLARQSWQYRQRLQRHWADGRLIESRLFVLTKPAGPLPVR
jgi:ubiquinone/menaquinone biosynthesis C-methylase UbiE